MRKEYDWHTEYDNTKRQIVNTHILIKDLWRSISKALPSETEWVEWVWELRVLATLRASGYCLHVERGVLPTFIVVWPVARITHVSFSFCASIVFDQCYKFVDSKRITTNSARIRGIISDYQRWDIRGGLSKGNWDARTAAREFLEDNSSQPTIITIL